MARLGVLLAAALTLAAGCTAEAPSSTSASSALHGATTVAGSQTNELSGEYKAQRWIVKATGSVDSVSSRCVEVQWDQQPPAPVSCGGIESGYLVSERFTSPSPDGSAILHGGFVSPGVSELVIEDHGVSYNAKQNGRLFAVAMPANAQMADGRFTKDGQSMNCLNPLPGPDSVAAPPPPPGPTAVPVPVLTKPLTCN